MANVMFWGVQSRQRELKLVHAKIAIGATGAPTLSAADSLGVASVSRTSAGLYRITLSDKYSSLVQTLATELFATAEDITFQVKAADVSSGKTIDLFCKAGATATDPADGAVLNLTFLLKNTSV